MSLAQEYLISSITRLKYYKDLAERAFAQLDDNDFHFQPNEESNSIAIIIQHMAGNMLSRWTNFLQEDGEKSWRDRDGEFAVHRSSKKELMEEWEKGWSCFLGALDSLKEEDLMKVVLIRQEELTVVDAINRQLAHYPHHIGQILYIGKIIKNTAWQSLSIPRGQSQQYNNSDTIKDPAKTK